MWGFLLGVVVTVGVMYFRPDIIANFMSCVL